MKHIFKDARAYWHKSKAAYPHRCERPISKPRPEEFERRTNHAVSFIVCPFDGTAHWAFAEYEGLKIFERMYPK